jgi:hypothetical protein
VRPGLINAHDHLRLNHFGRLGRGPYANACEWAADIQARHADRIAEGRRLPRRRALLRGAWKNLLSGVTRVVHHDAWESDFTEDFPLEVVRVAFADSLGMMPDFTVPPDAPFALHVAEGIDVGAAEELRILGERGIVGPDLVAVHCVGVDAEAIAQLRASGCALVWCPTSNHFLFGRSAPGALLADGMDVLLGTDSLLTGAGDLLDEIRAARGSISDARLLDAVGALAARRLGLPPLSLAIGTEADLVVLRRPLLEADAADVALVMAGGALRVLDPGLLPPPRHGRLLEQHGVQRWISEEGPMPF